MPLDSKYLKYQNSQMKQIVEDYNFADYYIENAQKDFSNSFYNGINKELLYGEDELTPSAWELYKKLERKY
jgi:hypothetical protein